MRSGVKIILLLVVMLFIAFGFGLAIDIPFWVYLLVIILWVLFIMIAAFSIRWNFFLKSFNSRKGHTKKEVAITFDDGPHPKYTSLVLELLEKYEAKATFFLIGREIEKQPELVKKIIKAGHQVGNHSYSHNPAIGFSSTKTWLKEIESTDDLLQRLTGEKPTLFRPPYGVTTPHLANAILRTSHTVVGWNVRSYDTVIKNVELIKKRATNRIKPGSILLFHDTHEQIPVVLEHLLLFLQQNQFRSVTVKELFDED